MVTEDISLLVCSSRCLRAESLFLSLPPILCVPHLLFCHHVKFVCSLLCRHSVLYGSPLELSGLHRWRVRLHPNEHRQLSERVKSELMSPHIICFLPVKVPCCM